MSNWDEREEPKSNYPIHELAVAKQLHVDSTFHILITTFEINTEPMKNLSKQRLMFRECFWLP